MPPISELEYTLQECCVGPVRWKTLTLSETMYVLISLGKSTPPQDCQLNISNSNCKQQVDDFVGELTF